MLIKTLISQINFIPNYENVQRISVIIIFAISALLGLFYFIKYLANNYRNNKNLKFKFWLKSILFSGIVIVLVVVLFLCSVLSVGQEGFIGGPVFIKKYEFNNVIIYQYENACFPPDSVCECQDYYSLIYIKNSYFPIMHLKEKVNSYIESIKLINNSLYIKASGLCGRDINREIIVLLN